MTPEKECTERPQPSGTPPPCYGAAFPHNSVPGQQTSPLLAPTNAQPKPLPHVINMQPAGYHNVNPPRYDKCHLVWAALSIFMCCACGTVAALMTSLGYSDFVTGNYVAYRKKRRCAIGFTVIAILLGVCIVGAYVACKIIHGEDGGWNRIESLWDSD